MPTFQIEIEYYDEEEKNKIQANFPADFEQINRRLGKFNVSFEDFQAYSLFRHQCSQPGTPRSKTSLLMLKGIGVKMNFTLN